MSGILISGIPDMDATDEQTEEIRPCQPTRMEAGPSGASGGRAVIPIPTLLDIVRSSGTMGP